MNFLSNLYVALSVYVSVYVYLYVCLSVLTNKIWDPRDGSFVRVLRGHSNEVMSVRYSGTEQFLVSAGADAEVLVWSMLTLSVVRRLLGHIDVIYRQE